MSISEPRELQEVHKSEKRQTLKLTVLINNREPMSYNEDPALIMAQPTPLSPIRPVLPGDEIKQKLALTPNFPEAKNPIINLIPADNNQTLSKI